MMTKKWSSTASGDGQTKREASKAARREAVIDECQVCFGIGTIYPKRPDGRIAYTAVECPRCGIGDSLSSSMKEKSK